MDTRRKFNREFKLEAVEMVKGLGALVHQGHAPVLNLDYLRNPSGVTKKYESLRGKPF